LDNLPHITLGTLVLVIFFVTTRTAPKGRTVSIGSLDTPRRTSLCVQPEVGSGLAEAQNLQAGCAAIRQKRKRKTKERFFVKFFAPLVFLSLRSQQVVCNINLQVCWPSNHCATELMKQTRR